MNQRFMAAFLALFLIFALNCVPVMAQSGSYLETIYQAGDSGTSAMQNEEDVNFACPLTDDNPEIIDAPEPIGDPKQQQAIERLQKIIDSLMRVLSGKLCGTKIIVIVIPCERIVPKPKPVPENPPVVTKPPTTPPATPPTTPKPTTPKPTTPAPVTPKPTTPPVPPAPPAPPVATTPPTPEVKPPTTPAPPAPPAISDKEAVRAGIKAKYGIDAADGSNQTWSENQLKAADEALATLPPLFQKCTDVIFRDGPPYASFIPSSAAAYVIVPQHKVHMLDLSAQMTQGSYNSLVAAYGRAPTQAEQMAYLKHNFKRTLVHEMTHCFQNTYPQIYQNWSRKFWPGGRLVGSCPTGYGRTQPAEDMAESVATYWTGGTIRNGVFVSKSGAVMDLERYNFIKQYIMSGKEF